MIQHWLDIVKWYIDIFKWLGWNNIIVWTLVLASLNYQSGWIGGLIVLNIVMAHVNSFYLTERGE